MLYKKLDNIKCDNDGVPLLIQDYYIENRWSGKILNITFFNGIREVISLESIRESIGESIGEEKLDGGLERLCTDWGIITDACDAYN